MQVWKTYLTTRYRPYSSGLVAPGRNFITVTQSNCMKIYRYKSQFGTHFEYVILHRQSQSYPATTKGSQVKSLAFFFQNDLYPIISLTSLTVLEALALAFSAPSETTRGKIFIISQDIHNPVTDRFSKQDNVLSQLFFHIAIPDFT